MRIGTAFPSKYLKAEDLGDNRAVVTIRAVEFEDIGSDDGHKAVVYFKGRNKGLVLNRTNANTITEIAKTDETDDWSGVSVVLYATKVDYQGKRVSAIRVDAPKPKAAPKPVREPDVDGEDTTPFTDEDDPPF